MYDWCVMNVFETNSHSNNAICCCLFVCCLCHLLVLLASLLLLFAETKDKWYKMIDVIAHPPNFDVNLCDIADLHSLRYFWRGMFGRTILVFVMKEKLVLLFEST